MSPIEAGLGDALTEHGAAFRAMNHVAEEAPALVHVPALGQEPRAVGEGVLDEIMVEELVGKGSDLAASLPLAGHGPCPLDPAADVEVMNQPVEEEAAVEPGEIRVVADLVGQLALAGSLRESRPTGECIR